MPKKNKKLSTFIVYHGVTGEVKEQVYSTYAAKQRTLFHNNMAYEAMQGSPYKWKKVSG